MIKTIDFSTTKFYTVSCGGFLVTAIDFNYDPYKPIVSESDTKHPSERRKTQNMIVFRGTLNAECEEYVKSKLKKAMFIKAIVLSVMCTLPIVFLGIVLDSLFFLFLIAPLPIIIEALFNKKSRKDRPEEIIIDDTCVEIKAHYSDRTIPLEKISALYDMGTWYKVNIFNFFNTMLVFQKDLIVEGTLEEFETLFQDKIV